MIVEIIGQMGFAFDGVTLYVRCLAPDRNQNRYDHVRAARILRAARSGRARLELTEGVIA